MGKTLDRIDERLKKWIGQQKIFFVATAPLAADGHINCSPKGGDAFRVLGAHEVAYLDYTGSGIETAAHLRENGRILIMFCAFEGPPDIVRLHGLGHVLTPGEGEYDQLATQFPANPGARAIIRIKVTRISESCGYSVPFYEYKGHRAALDKWAATKGPEGIRDYQQTKNLKSIDGLPGLS